ncbi:MULTISPECIES: hypothetical protein [unclassified Microcoleus]|jgi:hypothetical protein|uniref:hypothetical protein n=2 Tax=unclassified Microcoleus TaxID=2642155 RepID=UPI0025DB699E|nr:MULTISPECIES: hypothetical protein [unclassified Microcoleus]
MSQIKDYVNTGECATNTIRAMDMKKTNFPIRNSDICQENPLAFVSGNLIHILYPNGEVEAISTDQINRHHTKNSLDKCLVWGYVGDF